ncbi:hypothetical protein MNB_SV-8-1182 [hydrothermal vent metagenome]|uniref:Uncharacterized protein n=1 Tax=hydrothermal vent metagenome TaxID=652676 RepID=A0A1W1BAA1_9ZZZZ
MVYQEFTKEEARELGAFREDALSEKDAISAAYYPYGENCPTAWDNFYNKWLALDLSRTGGFPSVLLGTLLVITAPFTLSKIWIIDPVLQKIRG